MRIDGRLVGDVLWEIYGPIIGRNKFTADSPDTVYLQVVGTGEITVQSNQEFIFGSTHNPIDLNPSSIRRIADPTAWANEATIDQTDGITPVVITATNDIQFIRVLVSGAGTGRVTMSTAWW